uniref:Uncharacterized protein n=1 Tax=Rhizophora mucronata TaxID=61149 RepID=A0A2P2NZY5_RHIMU
MSIALSLTVSKKRKRLICSFRWGISGNGKWIEFLPAADSNNCG